MIILIDIVLLGTSALIPLPDRALTAAVLYCRGHSILFDCGEWTQAAARKAGASLMQVDMVALTHYHGDHIFGMPGLMQTLCSMGRTEPLYITGPEGMEEELAPILKLVGWTSYEIRMIEVPKEGLKLAELDPGWPQEAMLHAFKTEHRISSQGYSFTLGRPGKFMPQKAKELGVPVNQWGLLQKGNSVRVGDMKVTPDQVLGEPRKGLKFVFSGDTAVCDTLIDAAKDADLLIAEATYGENGQAQLAIDHGHMNFAQAAAVASRSGARQLWLAHYSQMIEDPEIYLPNAAEIFPETHCGKDGMRTSLQFEK